MASSLYDISDFCLRTSLFATGNYLASYNILISDLEMTVMTNICRLGKLLGHRKSEEYTWEKDIHNGKKSFRRKVWGVLNWFYEKVYDKKLVLYCGLNCDQYRALSIYLYLTKNTARSRRIARNILLGYVLRLGISPSLTEMALIKPYSFILLFKMFWYLYPIYLLVKPLWLLSKYRNLKEPIEKSTTNKISLLPTMFILKSKMPDNQFIIDTYNTYFGKNNIIRNSLVKGLIGRT